MKYFSIIYSILYIGCFIFADEIFVLSGIRNSDFSSENNINQISKISDKYSVSNTDLYCGVLNKCRQYYKNLVLKKYEIEDMCYKKNDIILINFNDEENLKRIKWMFMRSRYIVLLYYKYKFHSIVQSSIIYNIENVMNINFYEIIHTSTLFITDEINNRVLWMGIVTVLISSQHINVEKGMIYCNTFKELYQTINAIESYPNVIKNLQNYLAKFLLSQSYIFNQKKYIYYQFINSKMTEELKLINNSKLIMDNIFINTNSHNFISLPSVEKLLSDSLYKYVKVDQHKSIVVASIFIRLLHISDDINPQVYDLFISLVNETHSSDKTLVYLYTSLFCSLEKRNENSSFALIELNKLFLKSLDLELYCDMVNFTIIKNCYTGLLYYSLFFDNVKESRSYKYVDLIMKFKYVIMEDKGSMKRVIELFPLSEVIYNYAYDMNLVADDSIYPNRYTKILPIAYANEYNYFCLYKRRISIPDDKKLLIFYVTKNTIWFKAYGPSSLGGFLGGSEESLIEVTNELGELGYWVEVYCKIKLSDQARPVFTKSGGCIIWYPIECLKLPLKEIKNLLLFIVFRSYHGLYTVDEERNYKVVLWLKDEVKWMKKITWVNSYIDYVIIQSEFHKSLINEIYYNRSYLINVQLYTHHLDLPLMNENNIFIYASQPNRGLDRLIYIWDRIRKEIPNSELHVFYDFHDNYIKYLKGEFKDDVINNFLYKLYSKPGVILHGGANQDELSYYFARAGFFLYPTTYPEVGCITCIKAMSYGCIPITSLFNYSVLPEITKEFDLGCKILKGNTDSYEEYGNRILEAVKMNLTEKRIKMKKWVNEKFSIKTTIKVWEKLISDSQINN